MEDENVCRADAREIRYRNLVQIGSELAVKHISRTEYSFRTSDVFALALPDNLVCLGCNVFKAEIWLIEKVVGLNLRSRRLCDIRQFRPSPPFRQIPVLLTVHRVP